MWASVVPSNQAVKQASLALRLKDFRQTIAAERARAHGDLQTAVAVCGGWEYSRTRLSPRAKKSPGTRSTYPSLPATAAPARCGARV